MVPAASAAGSNSNYTACMTAIREQQAVQAQAHLTAETLRKKGYSDSSVYVQAAKSTWQEAQAAIQGYWKLARYTDEDIRILATTVYYEAGGTTEQLREYVAQVVLNRVADSRFPDTIYGVVTQRGQYSGNYATASATQGGTSAPLLASVCATSFAYEGWIIATSINAELKDAKKNLPRALIIGGIIIIATYIAYYVGVAGGASVDVLMKDGATVAFVNIFGGVLGNILNLFIAISCAGTMNGLMLGCCRGAYSLAARGEGPKPALFSQVDTESNLPHNSAILGLLMCGIWGTYFMFASLFETWGGVRAFVGTPLESVVFSFDASELPIITIYAMYLPIFINWMRKAKDETTMRRYVIPILAIIGSLFMVYACLVGHKMENFWYLIVFAVIMLIGKLANVGKKRKSRKAVPTGTKTR